MWRNRGGHFVICCVSTIVAERQELIRQLMAAQNFNKLRGAMTEWLDGRDAGIVAEYTEMQEFRAYAKATARRIEEELSEAEIHEGDSV